jgi:hypothetical protein
MKRNLLFVLIASGLVVLAAGGWAVDGLRWIVGAVPRRVGAPTASVPARA